jgi:hypothetical protein
MKPDANFSKIVLGLSVGDTSYTKRFKKQIKVAAEVQAGKWHREV